MKKLSFFLIFIMFLSVFSSCAGIGDDPPEIDDNSKEEFELSYEISKREYRRGETFTLTSCVENISGKDLTYTAVIDSYYPTVELRSQSENGELGATLKHEPIDTVSGFDEFTAKAGQVGKKTFTFVIPEDAVPGVYSITLNYRGYACTCNDAIVVLYKPPHQYCDYTASSGAHTIKPISVLIGYTFYKNEEVVGVQETAGWEWIKSDSSYDPDEFPTLILDGELIFEAHENVTHTSINIYDTDYNSVEQCLDLSLLSPGEYVIVVIENVKTPAEAPSGDFGEYDYKLTKSALLFKLIVRS